jgi:hypothetical protein
MAIRPVDLQLAYLAAPQNAASVNAAQEAPAAASQAAQAAFAAQVREREEHVAEAGKAEGNVIRARDEGGSGGRGQSGGRRRREPERPEDAFVAPGDDEHFIDVTV